MSKKELDYKLPYYDRGVAYAKTIKISFVSNKVMRMYNEIAKIQIELNEINQKKQRINQEIAQIVIDKKMNIKQKMVAAKEKTTEEKKLNLELKDLNDAYVFNEKWKIVKRLLDDNGIDDENLIDSDFWDEKTETGAIDVFLYKCIAKDLPEDFVDKQKKKSAMKINL